MPAMTVSEARNRPVFMSLEPEWDALVKSTRGEVFNSHSFIRAWIDHFAPQAQLRVLIARNTQGELVAALPLIEERGWIFGAPVRQIVSASNEHSCRFDLIAKDPDAAGRAFFRHLAASGGWDLLRVNDVPEGGNAWRLYEAAEGANFPVGTWASLESPYIPLPSALEELLDRLQAKFKANVRRRRKKLEGYGSVTFERVDGAGGHENLDSKLREGYALEQSGWKGKGDTAIVQSKETLGFYTELARLAAQQGDLSLYFLRLNDKPVAFHYGITSGDRYYLLKPAYDEAYKECSPGHLLMDEVLKDCIARGLREFDFLGPNMPWKRDWADRARPHSWLFIFRDSAYGRMVCNYKFKYVPAVKRMVERWRK